MLKVPVFESSLHRGAGRVLELEDCKILPPETVVFEFDYEHENENFIYYYYKEAGSLY